MQDEERERHQRLWRNGHSSSELDIVPGPVWRRQQIQLACRYCCRSAQRWADVCRLTEERKKNKEQRKGFNASVDEIQMAVCVHFGISHHELLSSRRELRITRPRQVAMYLAKELTRRSLPEIGRKFGGRDHTTIMHAVRRIDDLLTFDAQVAADIAALLIQLEPNYEPTKATNRQAAEPGQGPGDDPAGAGAGGSS